MSTITALLLLSAPAVLRLPYVLRQLASLTLLPATDSLSNCCVTQLSMQALKFVS
jgi:hypothetical protein